MSKKLEKVFVEKLHKGECRQQVLWIYGDDSYLVSEYTKKFRTCLPADEVLVMQDDLFDAEEAASFILTLPFGGGSKLLEIRNLQLETLDARSFDLFSAVLHQIPEGVSVIMTYPSVIPDTKKNSRMMTLITSLGEESGFLELKKNDRERPDDFLYEQIRRMGGSVSRKTCSYIVDLGVTDRTRLVQEAAKLVAFADGEDITEKMTDKLVAAAAESTAFRMVDALTAGRMEQAVASLRILLDQREAPEKILGGFVTPFLDAYRCKTAKEYGISRPDLKAAFSVKSDFRLDKGEKFASRYSLSCIAACIHEILYTDRSLKLGSGDVDPGVRMELMMAEIDRILKNDRGMRR